MLAVLSLLWIYLHTWAKTFDTLLCLQPQTSAVESLMDFVLGQRSKAKWCVSVLHDGLDNSIEDDNYVESAQVGMIPAETDDTLPRYLQPS